MQKNLCSIFPNCIRLDLLIHYNTLKTYTGMNKERLDIFDFMSITVHNHTLGWGGGEGIALLTSMD